MTAGEKSKPKTSKTTDGVKTVSAHACCFEMYDLIPAGYCTLSEQGLILESNLTASKLMDVSHGELVNQPITRFIFPEDKDIYHLHCKQLFAAGDPKACELRMVKMNGISFWAWLKMIPAKNTAGDPVNHVVLRDITEHKREEEALRKSDDMHRTILQTAMDGFCLVDTRGLLLEVNETYCRMTGYSAKELLNMSISDIEAVETEDEIASRIKKTAVQGEDSFESRHRRKDGSMFDVEIRIQYRPCEGRIVAFVRDITERKRAEEEKAKLEMQLIESQKMEAMGQLAGGISHDFNNLVSVINGYSQMLLKEPDLKADVILQIEEILRASERASSLIRQLLVFSRRQPAESRIIDLDAIISGVENMLRRLIREDIVVTRNTCPALWQIKADQCNIEQVIMNLVINAGDAMEGGGKLTIETGNVKIDETNRLDHPPDINPGLYVTLAVSDTGCGMDDKVMEHIFDPFFTTKKVGKGTGLGLSTVYGIVKQSNAYIDVQSELGKGTTFRIYFPHHVNKGDSCEERKAVDIPPGSETILLAEDDDSIRVMLRGALQSIGYTVLSACNGKEAFALAKNHKGEIHLLLADIVMPEMNGFELAKQLRKSLPGIKLLFMSGYAKPTDTHGMIRLNNNLIQKPIFIHSLAVKLREILEK